MNKGLAFISHNNYTRRHFVLKSILMSLTTLVGSDFVQGFVYENYLIPIYKFVTSKFNSLKRIKVSWIVLFGSG